MYRTSLLLLIPWWLLAVGCGSSGPAREDAYYRLIVPGKAAPVQVHVPGTILVGKLDGRGFAGDRPIVFRDDKNPDQVQRYTYHLWAEPPTQMIQDALAERLREVGIAEFVVTPAQRVRADYLITGTLYRMEHHPYAQPPEVSVELELGVVRADRRELLFVQRYAQQTPVPDARIESAIPAFGQAVAAILDRFVQDLAEHLKTK